MAKDLRFSLLLAFYRNLLSDKQVEMLESYYDHDLSLSEISENVGMSRQGVRDTIKRAEQQLSEYEEKLGLIKKTNQFMAPLSLLFQQFLCRLLTHYQAA